MGYKDSAKRYAYQVSYMAARRLAWLDANGPCARCGSSERLEVDHIDRTSKEAHAVWSWSASRREAELAKCQVLCHSCHLVKTTEDRRRALGFGAQRPEVACAECARVFRSRRFRPVSVYCSTDCRIAGLRKRGHKGEAG